MGLVKVLVNIIEERITLRAKPLIHPQVHRQAQRGAAVGAVETVWVAHRRLFLRYKTSLASATIAVCRSPVDHPKNMNIERSVL